MSDNSTHSRRYPQTQFALFSIVIYLLLSQFLAAIVPKYYLSGYLFRHTLDILISLPVIYILSLVYKPIKKQTISYTELVLYILAGILICVVVNYPLNAINHIHSKPNEYFVFIDYGLFNRVFFLILLGGIAPFTEEVFYRLYIYNMLKEEFSIATSVVVSAAIFMLMHFGMEIIYIFVPGVVYALVYEKTRTIWASVVVHGLNNLIWFYWVYSA